MPSYEANFSARCLILPSEDEMQATKEETGRWTTVENEKKGKNIWINDKSAGTAQRADDANLNKGTAASATQAKATQSAQNSQNRPKSTFVRSYYRKIELKTLFERSIYLKSEGNFLFQFFKSRPRTMKKTILTDNICDVDAIYISGNNLRIICKTESGKNQMKKIDQIDDTTGLNPTAQTDTKHRKKGDKLRRQRNPSQPRWRW